MAGEASGSQSRSLASRARAGFAILRPVNCLLGGLTVAIGFLNAFAGTPGPRDFTALAAAWSSYFLVAGGTNAVNDVFDLEVDRVNRPERPLPSGALTVREAWGVVVAASVAGTVAALLVGAWYPSPLGWGYAVPPALFSWVGYWYARSGKVAGFLGNVVVGVSFSAGLLFGAWLVTPVAPIHLVLFFGTSFSLLVARELVKGAEDLRGDAIREVKTVARAKGVVVATKLAWLFEASAVVQLLAAVALAPQAWLGKATTAPLVVCGALATLAAAVESKSALALGAAGRSDSTPADQEAFFHRASFLLKVAAFFGLLAFLVLSFF
ncbi:MAG: hypothetical protein Kow0069_04570 [Promethearchaeota archaeon]